MMAFNFQSIFHRPKACPSSMDARSVDTTGGHSSYSGKMYFVGVTMCL